MHVVAARRERGPFGRFEIFTCSGTGSRPCGSPWCTRWRPPGPGLAQWGLLSGFLLVVYPVSDAGATVVDLRRAGTVLREEGSPD